MPLELQRNGAQATLRGPKSVGHDSLKMLRSDFGSYKPTQVEQFVGEALKWMAEQGFSGVHERSHRGAAGTWVVMRTALVEMTALEWMIRSAPELYVRAARAVVATERVPRRLRQEVDRRFGSGFCEPLVKFVRDCVSRDLQPEDLMNVPTRVLAKAHATVAELCGPHS